MSDNARYRNIANTRDGEYLKRHLNDEGLRIIENILVAYYSDRIDIEVVRDEDGQIEFDKSGELIVKDKSYSPTGLESLVIKWVEDMENTDYLVDSFYAFSRNRQLIKAEDLVNFVLKDNEGKNVFYLANIIFTLREDEELLNRNEIMMLSERIYEASAMSVNPFLTAERIDAVRFLLEYGISEDRFSEFSSITPEQAKELLLNCNMDVFTSLVEYVALSNQEYYAPDCYDKVLYDEISDTIRAYSDRKPALQNVITSAEKKQILSDDTILSWCSVRDILLQYYSEKALDKSLIGEDRNIVLSESEGSLYAVEDLIPQEQYGDYNAKLSLREIRSALTEYRNDQTMSKYYSRQQCDLARSTIEGALQKIEDVVKNGLAHNLSLGRNNIEEVSL